MTANFVTKRTRRRRERKEKRRKGGGGGKERERKGKVQRVCLVYDGLLMMVPNDFTVAEGLLFFIPCTSFTSPPVHDRSCSFQINTSTTYLILLVYRR
jgi:hypothetical protein